MKPYLSGSGVGVSEMRKSGHQTPRNVGFRTTVGSDDPSSLFMVIPPEIVAALSEKKRPPVRVTLNGGYTYRSTIAVYGRRYPPRIRRETCGLALRLQSLHQQALILPGPAYEQFYKSTR